MAIEIAGLTYTREPVPGELIYIDHGDRGGLICVYVKTSPGPHPVSSGHRETIAWLQQEPSAKPAILLNQERKMAGLARKAEEHWKSLGFTVF